MMAVPVEGELYEAPDDEARIDERLAGETVWLIQRQMVELFDTPPQKVVIMNLLAEPSE